MVTMDEIGTDIKSSWILNEHGDLEIVSDEDNIIQSIVNRFNCWLNGLDLFYLEYGSILSSFLGWKRNEETLGFMRIEIENTLNQDPRITDYELNIEFNDNGGVDMHLNIPFGDEDLELNLIISEDGSIDIIQSIDSEE